VSDEYRGAVTRSGDWLLKREKELNAQIRSDYDALEGEMAASRSAIAAEEMEALREPAKAESWFTPINDPVKR
jgi:hypothetical protein